MLSQVITMTPEQLERRDKIFTAEKIIDISKAIDNEERQYVEIIGLQNKIDSLKAIVKEANSSAIAFSNEIDRLRKELRDVNDEMDEVNDDRVKNAKKPFLGLHSYARIKLQEFDYKKINFHLNLSYDFKYVSLGVYGETFSFELEPRKYDTEVYYGIFAQYKIF